MKREVLDKMRMASLLFTIEQFELLRRLRASGITRDQVALAFDHFDRLDWELQVGGGLLRNNGGRVSSAASSSPPQVNGGRTPLHVKEQDRNSSSEKDHHHPPHHGNGTNGDQNGRPKSSAQSACSVSSNEDSSATEGRCEQMTPPLQLTLAPPHKSPPAHRSSTDSSTSLVPSVITPSENEQSLQAAAALMATWPLMAGGPGHPGHGPSLTPNGGTPTSNGHLGVVSLQTPTSRGTNLVSSSDNLGSMVPYLPEDYCPPDVEELKRKGEEALLSEIRNFVMRYNIKQTMIAEMTKMSQAYVSRFFRGDIADMSERTKNTFYMWYLTCKNNPWKLGVKRMVSENGDLIPLKRERFTFKTAHLTVLDRYYERDPYPDAQTREQIVEECNAAVERPDRPLADREKVTLPVVNNWFNNRRKEAKKQLRQQHAQMAAAAAAQQESPPPAGFAAALHAMQGWQQQLLQSSATALSAIAGATAHSPPPQPQPGMLAGHPGLAGMAALAVASHSNSVMEDDDDDSRGSYSIPEETMAIDFSEGGAAARENRESRDATSGTPASISLSQSNELNIKQEAVS